jgi:glycogen(starch) synthase
MLRVLHVLDHSLPLHSGYTFRTLSLLQEQGRRGWQTFQITGPKQGGSVAGSELVDGWTFFRTPAVRAALPVLGELAQMDALAARLEAVVAEVRPDLLHAHSPVLNALPALRVGCRFGIPVVYEVRAFWEDAAVDHGTTREGSLRYRASRLLETWAMRRADHVFTICEGLRSDIVGRGLPAGKVSVIPNAVDAEAFEARGVRDEALASRLGLTRATVLGFLGSFYAYEGLDLLLDALPGLVAARPDIRVLLVGGGPQETSLRAQAAALGVADKVVFTGRVPHDEVGRYYELVDILVYPRHSMRLTELVTPLKPLEAMAGGKLVAASDVGGHRELVKDGVTGRLFSPDHADALRDVLLDWLDRRHEWPAYRTRARQFVEAQRTWRASVDGYVAPYARCTGRALGAAVAAETD